VTTRSDEPVAPTETTRQPSVTTRAAVPPVETSAASMVDTTEIPIAVAGPMGARYSYVGDGRYNDRQRRAPAPIALRAAVWVLFAIFVITLIGLAVEHFHPTWISFLRESSSSLRAHFGSAPNAFS
jgi:hypothetical protein